MSRREARMDRWTRAVGSSLRDDAACAKGRDTFTPANIKSAAGMTEISLKVTCRVGGFTTSGEKENNGIVCVADCSNQLSAIRACMSGWASKQFLNNYDRCCTN